MKQLLRRILCVFGGPRPAWHRTALPIAIPGWENRVVCIDCGRAFYFDLARWRAVARPPKELS